MYIYVYIYTYVCVHIYIYIYIYLWEFVCCARHWPTSRCVARFIYIYIPIYSDRNPVWMLSVCVLCGSPVWPSPPVVGPLRRVLPSVWVPCASPPPLSCPRFPWHLFLFLPLARAHALALMCTQQPRLPGCATVALRGVSCRACCDHGRSIFSVDSYRKIDR